MGDYRKIGGQRLTPAPASIAAPAAWLGLEGDLDKIREAATARRQHFLNELLARLATETEDLPDFFAPLLLLSAGGGGEGYPPAEGPE